MSECDFDLDYIAECCDYAKSDIAYDRTSGKWLIGVGFMADLYEAKVGNYCIKCGTKLPDLNLEEQRKLPYGRKWP